LMLSPAMPIKVSHVLEKQRERGREKAGGGGRDGGRDGGRERHRRAREIEGNSHRSYASLSLPPREMEGNSHRS
jgi:hypothetical protein